MTLPKILISILVTATLLISTTAYVSQITKDKTLWAFASSNLKSSSSIDINLCFTGVSSQTKVIILKDKNVSNLNEIFGSTITIRDGVHSTEETAITEISFSLANKELYLISNFFSGFKGEETYCLKLTTAKDPTSIKNLQLTAASSIETDRIIYNLNKDFVSFELYNTSTDNSLSSLKISENSLAHSPSTIYDSTIFSISFSLATNLNEGRIIPTKDDQVLIIIDLDNINVDSAEISLASQNNSLIISNPSIKKRTNRIIISKLGQDLVNGDSILITIERITVDAYSSNPLKAKVSLYWKNTNSLVSYYESGSIASISRYTISNISLQHVNSVPTLYTSSTWPVVLNFSVNKALYNDSLTITDSTGVLKFIPSTCDFSDNTKTDSICKSSSDASTLYVSGVSLISNTSYSLKLWVYLNPVASVTTDLVVTPSVSIQADNISDKTSISSIFNIKNGEKNNLDTINTDSTSNTVCLKSDDTTCSKNLYINENSGNFILEENYSFSDIDLAMSQPRKLEDFKTLRSNYFKLRFRYDAINTSKFGNCWAGEWISSGTQITDAQFALGSHSIYFPNEYYTASDTTSSCKVSWASKEYALNDTPTVDYTVLNYTKENSLTTANQKYSNVLQSTGLVTNNRLRFNNYSIVSGTKTLSRGLFYHLVRAVECKADNTCQTIAMTNSFTQNDMDLELASNCFKYNTSFKYKSLYASYDLVHQFSLSDTNTGASNLIRVNRFVSLLPQPGVFKLVEDFVVEKENIFESAYVWNNSEYDAICVLEIKLSSSSIVSSNYSNNSSSNYTNLIIFLNGANVIDFEDMNNYPTNKHQLKVVKNSYRDLNDLKNSETLLSDFNETLQSVEYSFFSNSSIINYFGNKLEFVINNDIITNNEVNKASTVIFPIKCDTLGTISLSFSDISVTDASNPRTKAYNLIYSYDNKDNRFSFISSKTIDTGHEANKVNLVASWNDFLYDSTTKINFAEQSTTSSTKIESEIKYMAILLKDNINNYEKLLNDKNVEVDSSYYIQLYSHNSFTFNNIKFNYILIKDRTYTTTNLLGLKNDAGIFSFNLQGIPIHINNNAPAKNGDIGIYLSGESGSHPSDDNYNYMLTNYDGQEFIVKSPSATSVSNDAVVIKKMSYITSSLKSGEGTKTICAAVELIIKPNVNYYSIYSNNFISRTIGEGKGFDANLIYSANSFIGKTPVFNNPNIDNSISLTFCNISVSTSSNFTISRLVYYFKDNSTSYFDYTFTNKIVDSSIPTSISYSAGVIQSYNYVNNRVSYDNLTLGVKLDNEVFRNMILTISADFSSLIADNNYTPSCYPYFDTEDNAMNVIWKTCKADLINNKITITTFNKVLVHSALPTTFSVVIYPVLIAPLDSIKFTVSQRLNNSNDSNIVLFPEISATITNNSANFVLDTSITPMNISSKIVYSNIEPLLPNIPGMMTFKINFADDNDVKTFVNTNNAVVNEIRLMIPSAYYGSIPDDVICYVNEIQIDNCTYDREILYIRTQVSLSYNITIGVYGFRTIPASDISKTSSVVLFTLANRKTYSRSVYFYGKTNISADFDTTVYANPSTTTTANFRMISQQFVAQSPLSVTNVSLNVAVDNLNGIIGVTDVTTSAKDFTISTIKGSIFYVTLPSLCYFSNTNNYSASTFSTNNPKITISTVTYDTATGNEKTQQISLTSISFRGKLIYATIDSDIAIDSNFRYFTINITNVLTTDTENRNGVFRLNLVSGTQYRISNFPLLITSVAASNQFNTSNPNQLTLIKERLGLIEYYRGSQFLYSNTKYYFSLNYEANIKPGVYNPINVKVLSKTLIANAETTLTLTNTSAALKLLDNSYSLDGRLKSSTTIYTGVSCGMYAGKYILRINSSNTSDFYNFPNAILSIDNNISTKTKITFYTSKDNSSTYNSSSNIALAIGGFVDYWVKPDMINIDTMEISFSKKDSDTTVASPTTLTIPSKSIDYVEGYYESPSTSTITLQSYNVVIKNNECFESAVSTISFLPNIVIESFDASKVTFSNFIYQNADSNLSLNNIDTNLDATTIKFYVNHDQENTLPTPSYLYCALYCADRQELTASQMKDLPYHKNTWYLSSFYKQIKTTSSFTMTFDNLVRDIKYKLQCLIESTEVDKTARSSVMRTIDNLNGTTFEAAHTTLLDCVNFYLSDMNNNFEDVAVRLLQETYFSDYEENGCIIALTDTGNASNGFRNNTNECLDTLDYEIFDYTSSSNNPTPISKRVDRSGRRVLKSMRSLQDTTDTPTDTTTTTDTTTSSTTDSTENNYKRICFKQHPMCPTKLSSASDFNNKLQNLITPKTTATNKSSRLLQTIVESSENPSEFKKSLSSINSTLSSQYLGYKIVSVSENYNFTSANITVDYASNFGTTSVDDIEYTTLTLIFRAINDSVKCWWSLNTNTNEEDNVDINSIKKCSTSTNTACGNSEGIVLPTNVTLTLPTSRFSEKEYAIWMTCSENKITSKSNLTPYLAHRVTSYYQKPLTQKPYVYECKLGNPEFPYCCATKEANEDNNKICEGCFAKFNMILGILAIFALIFN